MYNLSNFWINTKKIRNYTLDDPLIDWLDLYGNKNGLVVNQKKKDEFQKFLVHKSQLFKNKIKKQFKNIYIIDKKINITKRISLTINYMYAGKDIIFNAAVYDKDKQIYGNADILIRNDKIKYYDLPIELNNIKSHGSIFNDNYHYILITIKSANLKININDQESNILNTKKNIFIKSENILINQCLGKMQNYEPTYNFVISQKYNYTKNKQRIIINDYKQTIGKINIHYEKNLKKKNNLSIKWIKDLYCYGDKWTIFPPSREELYPNMCNTENDFPWHSAKKIIAKKLNEITLLWNCGKKHRDYFHNKGIYKWNDNKFNPKQLSFNENRIDIISKMIDINHFYEEIAFLPRKIKKKENLQSIQQKDIEFIVDFETINIEENENKKFSGLFMIGCIAKYKDNKGNNKTEFKQFTANKLNDKEEQQIVDNWILFMKSFKSKNLLENIKIFHWGNAEKTIFKQFKNKYTNYNIELNFVDILNVFKSEPIIVKDSFSYNLKDISKALYKHGIVKTIWEEDMNGKEAMINAWILYNSKKNSNNILDKIGQYNYYDCKVIDDIILFLRNIS